MSWRDSIREQESPKQALPLWLLVSLRLLLKIALGCLVIGFLISAFYFLLACRYDLDEVAKSPKGHTILDRHHNTMTTLQTTEGSSQPITRDALPQQMVDALLAREDTRFYSHWGVDPRGVLRAIYKNVKQGKFIEGASTLSMQLTKNIYNNKEESLHRKLLEAFITLRMEARYSKDEILTHYLNRIYLGSGSYGIEEAAQRYFNTTTNKLTLPQCALLAGIIRSPHDFSPLNNPKLALEQRDQVIKRMLKLGRITQEQADRALATEMHFQHKDSPYTIAASVDSYAYNAIERHAQEIIDLREIRSSELVITSSIDSKIEHLIAQDLAVTLPPAKGKNPLQTAIVVLDNATGGVMALIGGRDYRLSSFNRALDSKLALGEALYPFLYIAAIERGSLPIIKQPIVTARQLGYAEILDFCKRFGIDHKPSYHEEDLYRGGIHASPLQLASAFASLQSHGKYRSSYFIEKINTRKGQEIFVQQGSSKDIASPRSTQSLITLLKKHYRSDDGTLLIQARAHNTAWLIHLTPKTTTVLWLGHDYPQKDAKLDTTLQQLSHQLVTWTL